MSPETLSEIARSNAWVAIYPELALGVVALALLVLEVALPKLAHGLIPRIAILAQIVLLGVVLFGESASGELFGGMLAIDGTGQAFRVFFLLTSIFVSYLGMVALEKEELPRIEYFHIVLVVTGALMLMAISNHFVMLFVALETATVGFYVLVSYFRNHALSLEAGLKYLIMGALSSAILLFGIVLLYGVGTNPALAGHSKEALNFANLAVFLEANTENRLAVIGMMLALAGLAFKIAAFPFQIWVPDVYQGAPTPTTALLAVGSKAAGFAALINLMDVFAPLAAWLNPTLGALAALTILFGNFGALTQRNVKRIVGMSGVSHAGFLLVGVLAGQTVAWAHDAVLFYLFAYLFASMAVFAVAVHVPSESDAEITVDDFADLSKKNGYLALALAIGLGSLAGIPPLAGFIGKLLIFVAAFKAELYGLLVVSVIGVVVSIYYYFGWLKYAYFEIWKFKEEEEEAKPEPVVGEFLRLPGKLAIAVAVIASIVLGFYQGPVAAWLFG